MKFLVQYSIGGLQKERVINSSSVAEAKKLLKLQGVSEDKIINIKSA